MIRTAVLIPLLANQASSQEARDRPPLAITVRGDDFRGSLARIDEEWHITFDAGDRRHVLAADDLILWGEFSEREVGPLVVLADGGILVADREVRVENGRITISSRRLWEQIHIPLDLVRGVLYQPSPAPLLRDGQLEAISSAKGEVDQLTLANGDRLSGLIRTAGGESGDGEGPQNLIVETVGQSLTIPTERIVSVIFNPALIRQSRHETTHSVVGFRDGSRLVVDRFVPEQDRLKLTLAVGVDLESYPDFDAESVWDEITMVRPNSSRVTYLSDLEPISFKPAPYLGTTLEFRHDQNVRGGQLRAGGITYEKGIGMHSTSRLAYQLSGDHRQFAAEVAIDDLAGTRGSVQFRVYLADAEGNWSRKWESEVIRGGQAPVPLSLDVAQSVAIALIVDWADYGDQLDYANWLNARLVK